MRKHKRCHRKTDAKKLSMNYVLKLNTCPNNPAYSCVFEPPNSKLFEKSRLTPPLGVRILPLFEDSKIDLDVVDDTTVSIFGVNLSQYLGVNLNLRSVYL